MTRLRTPLWWSLARQDRRSAALARQHGALGLLMAAEQVGDVVAPARATSPTAPAARIALDVLWRTLHPGGLGMLRWNPGVAHLHQACHVENWVRATTSQDHRSLLRHARGLAADEFLSARTTPAIRLRVSALPPA